MPRVELFEISRPCSLKFNPKKNTAKIQGNFGRDMSHQANVWRKQFICPKCSSRFRGRVNSTDPSFQTKYRIFCKVSIPTFKRNKPTKGYDLNGIFARMWHSYVDIFVIGKTEVVSIYLVVCLEVVRMPSSVKSQSNLTDSEKWHMRGKLTSEKCYFEYDYFLCWGPGLLFSGVELHLVMWARFARSAFHVLKMIQKTWQDDAGCWKLRWKRTEEKTDLHPK